MFLVILAFILSYLLGSVNPAYLFGKMKGIDLRTVGTKNPGTRNVKNILGIKYAIVTAFYDVFKGIISILIAQLMGIDFLFAQLCGIFAIMGHNFPFYMSFRGGQGSASFIGIMLYYTLNFLITSPQIILILLCLAPIWILFHYISRRAEMVGLVLMAPFAFALYLNFPGSPFIVPIIIDLCYFAPILIIYLYKNHAFITQLIKNEKYLNHKWRVISRPLAVIFAFIYQSTNKETVLLWIGIPAIIFITTDLFRIFNQKTNEVLTEKIKFIFRSGEQKKFSSMTGFLCGVFISFLLFEINLAIVTLVFVIFGDLFGKLFGMAYGRHQLYRKTREGSLAYFGCVIICIYFMANLLGLQFSILFIGGICATIVEVIPVAVDDNFTVPIISGALMTALMIFL